MRYDLQLPTDVSTLPNGVRLVILPDATANLVAVVVHYSVGAAADPPGKLSLAHLAEHVSYEFPVGQNTLGAELGRRTYYQNAFTRPYSTDYVSLARPDELGRILEIEAARLGPGCEQVPAAVFERERGVVIEELRERGEPGRAVGQATASMFPPGHPSSRTFVDELVGVAAIDHADVCRFLRVQYAPARLTLAIAGRVSVLEARALATAALAAVPPRPSADRGPAPPVGPVARRRILTESTPEAIVQIGWPIPDDMSPARQMFLLDQLSDRNPRMQEQLARAADYDVSFTGDGGLRYVVATVALADPDDVDDAVDTLLEIAVRTESSTIEFESRRYGIMVERYLDWESLVPRAMSAVRAIDAGGDGTLGDMIRRVRDTDRDELIAARKQVLDPQRAVIRVILPGAGAKTQYPPALALRPLPDDPRDPEDRGAIPSTDWQRPSVSSVKLENGLEALLLPRRSPFPTVSARLVFFAGTAHAPERQPSVPEIVGAALETPRRRYQRTRGLVIIANPFHVAGARSQLQVLADTTVLSADGLDESLPQVLEGLEGWATARISLESEETTRRIVRTLARRIRSTRRGFAARVAGQVFGTDHPYGRSPFEKLDQQNVTEADLLAWRDGHFCAGNGALVIAGSFDPAAAERLVRSLFGEWPSCARSAAVIAPPAERRAPLVLAIPTDDISTLELQIAFATGPRNDGQRAARLVLAEMLRKRMEAVRRRLGASYGLQVNFHDNVGPGMIAITGSLDADAAPAALSEIRNGLQDVAREFAAARREVLSSMMVDLDSNAAMANMLAALVMTGLRPEELPDLVNAVAKTTPEAVAAIVRTELSPSRAIVVVRGPEKSAMKLSWEGQRPRVWVEP